MADPGTKPHAVVPALIARPDLQEEIAMLRVDLKAQRERAERAEASDTESMEMYRRCRERADALAATVETLRSALEDISRRPVDCDPDCNCNAARARRVLASLPQRSK